MDSGPDPQPLEADVLVDAEVPVEQERLLVDALAQLGVTARTRVVPARRGVEQLGWLVLASLPLQAFLTELGTSVADEAVQALRSLVRRLLHRDPPSPGDQRPMVLRDAATGLQVVLEPDLPDEAFRELVGLDLSQFRLGPVHFDRHRGRWRSELDEARG
jgi:hypothetical protein